MLIPCGGLLGLGAFGLSSFDMGVILSVRTERKDSLRDRSGDRFKDTLRLCLLCLACGKDLLAHSKMTRTLVNISSASREERGRLY